MLDDMHGFLRKQNWKLAEQEDPVGITWIELLALFEVTGSCMRQSALGVKKQLEEASHGRVIGGTWHGGL